MEGMRFGVLLLLCLLPSTEANTSLFPSLPIKRNGSLWLVLNCYHPLADYYVWYEDGQRVLTIPREGIWFPNPNNASQIQIKASTLSFSFFCEPHVFVGNSNFPQSRKLTFQVSAFSEIYVKDPTLYLFSWTSEDFSSSYCVSCIQQIGTGSCMVTEDSKVKEVANSNECLLLLIDPTKTTTSIASQVLTRRVLSTTTFAPTYGPMPDIQGIVGVSCATVFIVMGIIILAAVAVSFVCRRRLKRKKAQKVPTTKQAYTGDRLGSDDFGRYEEAVGDDHENTGPGPATLPTPIQSESPSNFQSSEQIITSITSFPKEIKLSGLREPHSSTPNIEDETSNKEAGAYVSSVQWRDSADVAEESLSKTTKTQLESPTEESRSIRHNQLKRGEHLKDNGNYPPPASELELLKDNVCGSPLTSEPAPFLGWAKEDIKEDTKM